MFLEVLADAEGFKISFSEDEIIMLAMDFEVDVPYLEEVVKFLLKRSLLQQADEKLFSQHLIDRLEPLLKKREAMRQKYQGKEEPPKAPPKKPKAPPEPEKKITLAQFEEFWKLYPKKEAKKDTETKFMKLKPEIFEVIMKALKHNIENNESRLRGYIPMPVTRINQERRNDEIPLLEK